MYRKKILVVTGIVVFLMMIVFNISLSLGNNRILSDLALANVEVLAQADETVGANCTVISYQEVWSGGCLYYAARCSEGYYVAIFLIHCSAR
jgi:hypothetical protein